MKTSQKQWVIDQLDQYGEVSRNNALQAFISRLGAIICLLNKSGWELEGKWRGGDYVYTTLTRPTKIIKRAELDTDGIARLKEIIVNV